jgi:hypothetical protein
MGQHDTLPEGLLASPDFFSISGCRDLLFHACEHGLTLAQIQSWLQDLDLTLIGFSLEDDVRARLQLRFPGVDATNDLDRLHLFETENPLTFSTMYDFWVRDISAKVRS